MKPDTGRGPGSGGAPSDIAPQAPVEPPVAKGQGRSKKDSGAVVVSDEPAG